MFDIGWWLNHQKSPYLMMITWWQFPMILLRLWTSSSLQGLAMPLRFALANVKSWWKNWDLKWMMGVYYGYIYMDYIGLCGNTMLYYWVECLDLQQEWKEWGYKPRRIWRWSSVKQQKWRSEPKWCMVEILGLCSYYFIFIFENMLEYLTTANHPSFQVPK